MLSTFPHAFVAKILVVIKVIYISGGCCIELIFITSYYIYFKLLIILLMILLMMLIESGILLKNHVIYAKILHCSFIPTIYENFKSVFLLI